MLNNQNTNKNIISSVFWKFGERIITQGISFIVSLVLARILMPEDYGAVAVLMIFIDIANVILISGLNTALIQKKEISSKEISTIFYCGLALSIVLYFVLFFFAPLLARLYNIPILLPVIRIFALSLPISSFQSIQTALISRNLEFKKLFFSTIGATICSAIVGISMALSGWGVWALVSQSLVSTLISTFILFFTVRWRPTKQFSFEAGKPLLRYGWKVMATDLSGTVFNHLSSIIIGASYTSVDLAYYTKGKQLPYLIRNNIYTTLISVLFPAMARVSDDPSAAKNIANKSIRMLSYIIFPLMFGLIAVSEDLVLVLLTEKWIKIVPFIWIVSLECIISIIPTISLQLLKASGYSDVMLKLEFIKKPILLLSILVAMKYGVIAIALTLPLNTMIDLIIHGIYSGKVMDYRLSEQIQSCLSSLILALLMMLAVWSVGLLNLPVLLSLVLQVCVGAAVYISLSAIFKVNAFITSIQLIKDKLKK